MLFNVLYLLSFPGCCCINSSLYFFANNMKPFIGLLGFSLPCSFSFLRAGEIGGDIVWLFLFPTTFKILLLTTSDVAWLLWIPEWWKGTGLGRIGATLDNGELGSFSPVENSKRRNLSHKSGVLTASWWSGGRHTSPTESSRQGIPNFSNVKRDCAELQPNKNHIVNYSFQSKLIYKYNATFHSKLFEYFFLNNTFLITQLYFH